MPIINLILNKETLTDESTIIYENNSIILMCTIYFFYICHNNCIVYTVYNHKGPN